MAEPFGNNPVSRSVFSSKEQDDDAQSFKLCLKLQGGDENR